MTGLVHPADPGDRPVLAVEAWGLVPYAEALARQEERVEQRRRGEIPDTLVLTEHPPVITLGTRPEAAGHVTWDEATRERLGVGLFALRRGGDATAHEPGQVVGYPIIDLHGRPDLHRYLRDVEQVLINTLGCLGLAASRRAGKTGVWLADRKIAAIGVAVRHWVTWHGFALNVDNDLSTFAGIVPCGIRDGSVTSLARELGRPVDHAEVRSLLAAEFASVLGFRIIGSTPKG